jgi:8-oxo-dGTP pyrophosphatase MutT (NUDIX family)
LPGEKAQQLTQVTVSDNVEFPYSIEQAMPAAVLILLFPYNNDIHFFLTERTNEVEHHKGQISLPGGAWEEGEKLHETAIRETEEEIGVQKQAVNYIGSLTPYFTAATGFMIHPFLSWAQEKPETKIHDMEVNSLFHVPISALIDEKTLMIEDWTISGYDAKVPFYNFNGRKVWGATAAILSEFKSILKEALD